MGSRRRPVPAADGGAMTEPRPWSWQLQHVTLPGEARRGRAARNVTPPADPPSAADAPPAGPESDPPAAIDPFVTWLFGRAGLSAAHYRPETLHRRLPA